MLQTHLRNASKIAHTVPLFFFVSPNLLSSLILTAGSKKIEAVRQHPKITTDVEPECSLTINVQSVESYDQFSQKQSTKNHTKSSSMSDPTIVQTDYV